MKSKDENKNINTSENNGNTNNDGRDYDEYVYDGGTRNCYLFLHTAV